MPGYIAPEDYDKYIGNNDCEKKIQNKQQNPRANASFLSILFWWWTIDLFKEGYSKVLQIGDLYKPLSSDKSKNLGEMLEKNWDLELKKAKQENRKPNLNWTIHRTFFQQYLGFAIYILLDDVIFKNVNPLLLGGLLGYFKPHSNTTYQEALYYAFGMCFASGVSTFSSQLSSYGGQHVGGQIRIALGSLVYKKALRLSKTALADTPAGKIMNLVATDISKFEFVTSVIGFIWSSPICAIITCIILYIKVGWIALIGVGFIFIVLGIQVYPGRISARIKMEVSIRTDERVRLMDEIISGIQVIKMYVWEKPFSTLVERVRVQELNFIFKNTMIRGVFGAYTFLNAKVALGTTLIAMALVHEPLDAAVIFIMVAYFGVFQRSTTLVVRGSTEFAESIVAARRLQNFLMLKEFGYQCGADANCHESEVIMKTELLDEAHISEETCFTDKTIKNILEMESIMPNLSDQSNGIGKKTDDSYQIKIDNLSCKWDLKSTDFILKEINLEVESGKLYCIVGQVGSGKSSLLASILGETQVFRGHVQVSGKLSYADQECWIFGGTVRQNILFGSPYDRRRYQEVIKVCALKGDLEQFPEGDQTLIGERGSSLSGGQKARVNLARAVYRKADIYLFDDPLSAVDVRVGKHIFQECFKKYLKDKTIILATHQLQFLKEVDNIVLLDHGKAFSFSNYLDLLNFSNDYMEYIMEKERKTEDQEFAEDERKIRNRQMSISSDKSRASQLSLYEADGSEDNNNRDLMNTALEESSHGVVNYTLWKFLRESGNLCTGLIIVLLIVLTQVVTSASDYYVTLIISVEERKKLNMQDNTPHDSIVSPIQDFLYKTASPYILAALVWSLFIFGLIRAWFPLKAFLRACRRIHDKAFKALIETKMSFFETNPSGRIVNRFSKDINIVDEVLPKQILDAIVLLVMLLGSLVLACIVNPWFSVPMIIIIVICKNLAKVYLKTSRNTKRLEGMTRSQILTCFNTTLDGLTTIRAFGAQNILIEQLNHAQDINTSAWWTNIVMAQAFGFALEFSCFIITTIITLSFIMKENVGFSSGEVGLTITQGLSLNLSVTYGVKLSVEVINQMISVERVLEYAKLKPEPSPEVKSNSLSNWPTEGHIKFQNLYLRYSADEPPVLKDLNVEIQPTEKIGIVGRTGAGKSSLISALFRLTDIEGHVLIDNVDTADIPLEQLRKNLSIIPQNPVLFSGTLRRNLDPFTEFSDEDLWNVLEEVELKEAVKANKQGLEHHVLDRGSNYSVGQRQLICLARAILRNNKILILDEATANVDPYVDSLIQRTIRRKFTSCTVLTVAHRLNTIIDSNKVMVMDKGVIMEFDHPHILLQNPNGHFTSLCQKTGNSMYEQLSEMAKSAYSTL